MSRENTIEFSNTGLQIATLRRTWALFGTKVLLYGESRRTRAAGEQIHGVMQEALDELLVIAHPKHPRRERKRQKGEYGEAHDGQNQHARIQVRTQFSRSHLSFHQTLHDRCETLGELTQKH